MAQRPTSRGSEANEGGVGWLVLGAWSGGGQREVEQSGQALSGCCGEEEKASEAFPRC
jgi:hypothetical protein